jgi:uroporphyrinogen decarboxylase
MTGRERVIATLTFSNPERAPRDLWTLPYVSLFRKDELNAVLEKFPSDFGRAKSYPGDGDDTLKQHAKVGSYTDEWGCVWELGQPGVAGEIKHPLIGDWSKLATYQPPFELITQRDLDYVNRFCDQSDLFMLSGVCARPFERIQFLRGTQNVFMDLAYGSKEIRQLLEMVHDFYLQDVRNWAKSNVDGIMFMDDWGTNRSLLIRPDTWRAVFKPLYREYCEIIHQAGKYAFFHSDGNIEAIYPDLIEVGVDALNSQLFCMDIERLAEKHRGEITFWGEIDRQHVLPFGTPDDVRQAVQRVRKALDTGNGGVIAQCEWGVDNSQENIETVFESWL